MKTEDIVRYIANKEKIPMGRVLSKTRKKEVVKVRKYSIWISRELLKESYSEISKHLGLKNHDCALHHYKDLRNLMEVTPDIRKEVGSLLKEISQNLAYLPKHNTWGEYCKSIGIPYYLNNGD